MAQTLNPRVSAVCIGDSVPSWASMGAHRIAYSALAYFERGHTRLLLNDRLVEVREGDCLLVPAGAMADIDSAFPEEGARRSRWWSVAFEGALADVQLHAPTTAPWLAQFVGHLPIEPGTGIGRGHVPADHRSRWIERLRELREQLATNDAGTPHAVQALMTLFAVDVGRFSGRDIPSDVRARPVLAEFFQYLNAHVGTAVSLSDIANALGFAPSYLTDMVKRETGRSAIAWLRELRMRQAERLLDSPRSIGEVAAAVGYDDERSFRRTFVASRGVSPDGWRRRRRAPVLAPAPSRATIVRDRDGFQTG